MTITVPDKKENVSILSEVLRDKFSKQPFIDRLCCRFNFHNRVEYENITFCGSCFQLLSGDEELLGEALAAARTNVEASNNALFYSSNQTFAYEDNCKSINVEDLLILEMLSLVRNNLSRSEIIQ